MNAGPEPLLRSVLYVPGHRADLIEKTPRYGADAVCLVLEDSVPDARKEEARGITGESIPTLAAGGSTVMVKVNPVDDPEAAEHELRSVVQMGLSAIIVPKTQRVEDVRRVDALLSEAESRRGMPTGSVLVLLLIETARAAHFAYELAAASSRVRSLISGTAANGDMARSLGFQWTPAGHERLYLRSKVLLDARAAGATALDGIYADVADHDGLVQEAVAARRLGYSGKLVVHPAHVELVNRVFTPSAEEVDAQRKVLQAFEAAVARGSAGVVVDGRFIDYAMAKTAERIIDLAARAEGRA